MAHATVSHFPLFGIKFCVEGMYKLVGHILKAGRYCGGHTKAVHIKAHSQDKTGPVDRTELDPLTGQNWTR